MILVRKKGRTPWDKVNCHINFCSAGEEETRNENLFTPTVWLFQAFLQAINQAAVRENTYFSEGKSKAPFTDTFSPAWFSATN